MYPHAVPILDRDRAGSFDVGAKPGFTLIEMMVVIAVITILALIAVPSYMDQLARGQIKEALPLADIAKKRVADAWAARLPLPADNAAAGLPPPEKVVSNLVRALAVEDGAIHITFGNRANKVLAGRRITLRPAVVEDAPIVPVAWVCAAARAPEPMTVLGVDRTDVPDVYRPLLCRATDP